MWNERTGRAWILMAAYDEERTIGGILERIPDRVRGRAVEVIVLDDGSTDRTVAIARASGAVVLSSPSNHGKGHALKRGLRHLADTLELCPADIVVWMDADGQHDPAHLVDVVDPIIDGTADMSVGSRYLRPADEAAPWNRRVVRRATIEWIARRTGFAVSDPFSGYRAFSADAANALRLTGDGYESELEALFSMAATRRLIVEVPIPRRYGPHTSKMGSRHGKLRGRLRVVAGYAKTCVSSSPSARRVRTPAHV